MRESYFVDARLSSLNALGISPVAQPPPETQQNRPYCVFHGEYITVTRRGDGTYHPNFRPIPTDKVFNLERYAAGVANELLWALEGLVEEVESSWQAKRQSRAKN